MYFTGVPIATAAKIRAASTPFTIHDVIEHRIALQHQQTPDVIDSTQVEVDPIMLLGPQGIGHAWLAAPPPIIAQADDDHKQAICCKAKDDKNGRDLEQQQQQPLAATSARTAQSSTGAPVAARSPVLVPRSDSTGAQDTGQQRFRHQPQPQQQQRQHRLPVTDLDAGDDDNLGDDVQVQARDETRHTTAWRYRDANQRCEVEGALPSIVNIEFWYNCHWATNLGSFCGDAEGATLQRLALRRATQIIRHMWCFMLTS